MPPVSNIRRRPGAGGFSLLELVLVIALIGTLLAIATSRLVPYVGQAERVAVMRMEGQLSNVLLMEAALLIARGESARLVELEQTNPMQFLLQPPATYLGELDNPGHEQLPRRSWHFDTSGRRLVYRSGRGFASNSDDAVTKEYSVRIRFEDKDGNARFTPGRDEFHGVRLEPVATPHVDAG